MNSFWKNEWDLFKKDVDSFVGFLMQPVTFSESNLMLKPSSAEIAEKADTTGFWKNEWQLFTKEFDSALNYLTKPISFK